MNTMAQTYRHEECEGIPDSAGVYAYFYNPFQRNKLGLFLDKVPTDGDIQRAKRALTLKLERYAALKRALTLSGSFREIGMHGAWYKSFSGSLVAINDWVPELEIESLAKDEFLAYVSMADRASTMFHPLYCGMTINQGLKSRWGQHKQDFETERVGTFGGRLREVNLDWTDLIFGCVPMTLPGENRESIRKLERHLMFLCEPTLSIR
jgi:hypothetical protein